MSLYNLYVPAFYIFTLFSVYIYLLTYLTFGSSQKVSSVVFIYLSFNLTTSSLFYPKSSLRQTATNNIKTNVKWDTQEIKRILILYN